MIKAYLEKKIKKKKGKSGA